MLLSQWILETCLIWNWKRRSNQSKYEKGSWNDGVNWWLSGIQKDDGSWTYKRVVETLRITKKSVTVKRSTWEGNF